jgi:hypothetical protein
MNAAIAPQFIEQNNLLNSFPGKKHSLTAEWMILLQIEHFGNRDR